ncbi:MAG TPA: SDR family oxidoreductase [Verrucomicrobiae bacterium]|jgi:NAD(P)-dependent dehydrogenase (short-subunit alcohol dehydrogenase family)|nr:SDR family oxidoreductase [Verrucomicrobiae bacterium]
MDAKLKGKTALVTGGCSGIGRQIARALAEEGVAVAIADLKPDPTMVEEFTQWGVPCHLIPCDVSVEKNVNAMVSEAIAKLGKLDFYINNAAAALHQPATKITTEAWHTVLNTNLAACVWGCREASRHMIARGGGGILIVGSTSIYTPGPAETVYRISKLGLKSLSQSLAIELAPFHIRVNLLVPGHYQTRLTAGIPPEIEAKLIQQIPLRRFGNLRECGCAAVMLLSDELSGYTTGAELVVDGGLHLRTLHFLSDEKLAALNQAEA